MRLIRLTPTDTAAEKPFLINAAHIITVRDWGTYRSVHLAGDEWHMVQEALDIIQSNANRNP